jgi:hypothetical protein
VIRRQHGDRVLSLDAIGALFRLGMHRESSSF